ncbi:uncharacterized protein CTRU02_214430 [Colletotrichum truncatum]|uniref:Uncharacterized protein n=1 Tax=Colletotrichum truncatum TaxID=5467 RepID=A0ACC3YEU9_COLTU|nr:uncharacterized protein CTRU02_13465 [Colletotrichum truncatum]KAF6783229.1 hypothetical protein CTRU02_13465 [Colletotrichum truncatum]
MRFSTFYTVVGVIATTTVAAEQNANVNTERQTGCGPLWEVTLAARQEFITKRETVNPLGLEQYDQFFGYFESGMYNMLESCSYLHNFRYPPRSDRREAAKE